MKSKSILRKEKELHELQKKNKEAIPFRAGDLNSFRLKEVEKVEKANSEHYSYVVPWQMEY
ncbi:hypothetical protein [Labilibaculum antarcticum]|uniref:Uncharacterized protein n=1 Tax=Labilibaculum antarcticum TaxID=1717717 RepID=A0A1Y1CDK9_9BACT|nr:hypothetical protein [Labilibaculum antarcticum]BAX78429.1 hypothetical protein ALGA_0034 [Labilibaculum antarcticum]